MVKVATRPAENPVCGQGAPPVSWSGGSPFVMHVNLSCVQIMESPNVIDFVATFSKHLKSLYNCTGCRYFVEYCVTILQFAVFCLI